MHVKGGVQAYEVTVMSRFPSLEVTESSFSLLLLVSALACMQSQYWLQGPRSLLGCSARADLCRTGENHTSTLDSASSSIRVNFLLRVHLRV